MYTETEVLTYTFPGAHIHLKWETWHKLVRMLETLRLDLPDWMRYMERRYQIAYDDSGIYLYGVRP